jgi:hypothetical protein
MDYMLDEPEEPIRRDEDDLEPDEWSDEDADRAEDRWIAERDSYYK